MLSRKPLAVDLCSGLGGWAEGLEAEGYDVIRIDIEDMFAATGTPKPEGCLLMLQDILTLHGSQIKHAALIVASPPCQQFSWMAMPWSRAKQVGRALRGEDEFPENYRGSRTLEQLTALFDACFRIQREACEAAGHHIPMVLENVKGAQPWVGRARWSFGSYFLWGDVPALMPIQKYHQRQKVREGEQWNINRANFTGARGWDEGIKNGEAGGGSWFAIGSPGQLSTGGNPDGRKNPGFRFDGSGRSFQSESVDRHTGHRDSLKVDPGYEMAEGRKGAGYAWFKKGIDAWRRDPTSAAGSHGSKRRKAASAKIAKIPFDVARYIGRAWKPQS